MTLNDFSELQCLRVGEKNGYSFNFEFHNPLIDTHLSTTLIQSSNKKRPRVQENEDKNYRKVTCKGVSFVNHVPKYSSTN